MPVPEFRFLLADPANIALQFADRVIVIDKKTGGLIGITTEKPSPDPWIVKLSEALSRIRQILQTFGDLKRIEKPGPDPWHLRLFDAISSFEQALLKPQPDPRRPERDPWRQKLSEAGFKPPELLHEAAGVERAEKTNPKLSEVSSRPSLTSLSDAISVLAQVLHTTEGLKGVEDLRLQTTKLLLALVEKISQEVQVSKLITDAA